jgi:hypothetical protein
LSKDRKKDSSHDGDDGDDDEQLDQREAAAGTRT